MTCGRQRSDRRMMHPLHPASKSWERVSKPPKPLVKPHFSIQFSNNTYCNIDCYYLSQVGTKGFHPCPPVVIVCSMVSTCFWSLVEINAVTAVTASWKPPSGRPGQRDDENVIKARREQRRMATPKKNSNHHHTSCPHPNQTSNESYETTPNHLPVNQGQGTHIEHQHKIITSKQSTYTPQLPAFTICYFGLVDNLQGDPPVWVDVVKTHPYPNIAARSSMKVYRVYGFLGFMLRWSDLTIEVVPHDFFKFINHTMNHAKTTLGWYHVLITNDSNWFKWSLSWEPESR